MEGHLGLGEKWEAIVGMNIKCGWHYINLYNHIKIKIPNQFPGLNNIIFGFQN